MKCLGDCALRRGNLAVIVCAYAGLFLACSTDLPVAGIPDEEPDASAKDTGSQRGANTADGKQNSGAAGQAGSGSKNASGSGTSDGKRDTGNSDADSEAADDSEDGDSEAGGSAGAASGGSKSRSGASGSGADGNGGAGTSGKGAMLSAGCDSGGKMCKDVCIPKDECCSASECPEGALCQTGKCLCPMGKHLCEDSCVSDDSVQTCGDSCEPCEEPKDGIVECIDGACKPSCPMGQHLCEDDTVCKSDDSPMSCGEACDPCPEPMGGSAECVAGECQPVCPMGQQLCVGECIPEAMSCQGECPSGKHDCSGNCVEDTSPMTCGTMCDPCPVPDGGSATCDGKACGIKCGGSTPVACEDSCAKDCCKDDDCPGEQDKCVDGQCKCQPQCTGKKCGDNGCEGSCGDCKQQNYECNASGQCECVPSCNNVLCGDNTDGCGGSCGCSALLGQECANGFCQRFRQLYETCSIDTPAPEGKFVQQGDCGNGLICAGAFGSVQKCYRSSSSGCSPGWANVFGAICMKTCTCDAMTGTCSNLSCFTEFGTTCVVRGELGGFGTEGVCS